MRPPADDRDPSAAAVAEPISPARSALQLVASLMCVLFLQGCQGWRIQATLGPLAPALKIDYDCDNPLQSKIESFAPHWLLVNLAGLGTLFYGGIVYSDRLGRVFRSREFYLALFLVAAIFNSLLYWLSFWQHAVFLPVSKVYELIMLGLSSPEDATIQGFVVGLSARLYFTVCLCAAYLGLILLKKLLRRYAWADPERWWQFNLGSLLTLTLVAGTALGMALRMLIRS